MKLDDQTLNILKNFQMINPSIKIDAGNTILTKSVTGTVAAKATVPVEFPVTFAIYELKKFLQVANMMKDADIEFDEKFLTFKIGSRSLRYTYCNPETIVYPNKKPVPFSDDKVFFQFTLTAEMLKETLNGMSVLGNEGISLKGQDGKFSIQSLSKVNNDVFSIDVGETSTDFELILESEKLNLIQTDYLVSLTYQRFLHLASETVEYWIAAHDKSYVRQ